jgi:transcriptional regulator with XRE-family HTH domain
MDEELMTRVGNEFDRMGERLRKLRTERGWRLDDLAQRTGLSKSYLSRIESGEREPSVAALFAMTLAYGISMHSLFEPEPGDEARVIIRADTVPIQRGNGLLYTALSAGGIARNLQPLRVVVPAGRKRGELYRHEGEEWLYVLSGKLGLILGEKEHELEVGDAAHFDASEEHRLLALNEEAVEVILVATSLPRPLVRSYL